MNSLRSLTIAAALAGAVLATTPVHAQTSSGALMGKADAGTVVTVHNEGSGMTREVTVKKSGRYDLRNLPTGTYSVTLRHADGSTTGPILVAVRVGTATRVP